MNLKIGAIALAIGLVSPQSAWAIQEATPEPGWTYAVAGVAQSDTLNVREQPGTQGPVIGRLEPSARNVTVAGTRMEIGGSVWWEVITASGTGWVNARYLTPVSTDSPATDYPLTCQGTEPFWSLRIDGDTARLTTPETLERGGSVWTAGRIRTADGNPGARSIRLSADDQIGHLAAIRTYHFCSDGMSDIQYPFDAVVAGPDGVVRAGCCARGG